MSKKIRTTKEASHKFKFQSSPYFFSDFMLILAGIVSLKFFRADFVAIAIFCISPLYFFFTARKNILIYFLISSSVAIFWQSIAGPYYGYNTEHLRIFYIDSYPLFAWAIGLFGIMVLYKHFEELFNIKNVFYKFLVFVFIYYFLLLTTENIAYFYFDIMNVQTTGSPPLPFCNCLHIPGWMQAWYLSAGPMYFVLCEYIKHTFKLSE